MKRRDRYFITTMLGVAASLFCAGASTQESKESQAIDIGQRLELFVDRQLIEKLEGVDQPRPILAT